MRALAVIPVVLFHAGVPGFGGGFVGVDVFFVISGYLISGVILSDLQQGRFSLADFYERRARRILPALIPVLLTSALAAWAVMIPDDFRRFAKGMGASAAFASNMLFARGSGYFDDDEGFAPLLHTWSLSVEEQFYILFPALVMLLWWSGQRRLHLWFAALVGISLIGCLALAGSHQTIAFYYLPTRAWELLLGAFCMALPQGRANPWLALSGLSLVLAGQAFVDAASAPDWRLMLPVLGTGLLLRHARPDNGVGRMLSLRPLGAIGSASYGLYLWHNPLLAFARYQWLGTPPVWLTSAVVALSVVLGFASLHLVERPVRARRMLASRKALTVFCVGGLALCFGLGVAGAFEKLEPESAARRDALFAYPAALPQPVELMPAAGAAVPYILFGDSHARQYLHALATRAGEGAMLTQAGCFSLPGVTNYSYASREASACASHHADLARRVRERGIPVVIIANRWDRALFDPADFHRFGRASQEGWPRLEAALDQLRDSLPAATRIVIIGSVPTAASAGPEMVGGYLRCLAFVNTRCPQHLPREKAEGFAINPLLARYAATHPGVRFFDPQEVLCGPQACDIVQGGKALYFDDTHLTPLGADRVIARLLERIGPI